MAKLSKGLIGGLLRLHLRHELKPCNSSSTIGGWVSPIYSPNINDALNPTSFHRIFAIHSRSYASNGFSPSNFLFKFYFRPVLSKSASTSLGVLFCPKGLKSITHRNLSSSTSSCSPSSSLKYILSHPRSLPMSSVSRCNLLWFRFFSTGNHVVAGKLNRYFSKSIIDKTVSSIRYATLRYQEAIRLQIDGFWKRNYLLLVGVGAVIICALLWRFLFKVANTLTGFSEGMAKYGFLALSVAIVAFSGLYLRSRLMINPDRVYRMAMRRLNMSAGILEVLGAPLSGTDLRAYVMSGGGLTLKKFKPGLRSKRCFLIFPLQGSERKGLVSVEVKKNKGKYDMRLLAVDIPMASGSDQRVFLAGNEEEYKVGGGLISELRDPVVKAMAASKEFEDRDEIEDEQDAQKELQEAEQSYKDQMNTLEKGDGDLEGAESSVSSQGGRRMKNYFRLAYRKLRRPINLHLFR